MTSVFLEIHRNRPSGESRRSQSSSVQSSLLVSYSFEYTFLNSLMADKIHIVGLYFKRESGTVAKRIKSINLIKYTLVLDSSPWY